MLPFVAHPTHQLAGVWPVHGAGSGAGGQPIEVFLPNRTWPGFDRPQLDHWAAMPGDRHALAGKRTIYQVRQTIFGFCHAVLAHGANIAIR
jgi:hypothetical protein